MKKKMEIFDFKNTFIEYMNTDLCNNYSTFPYS